MTKRILTLPAQLRRSITWDQGKEMAEHVRFSVETGVQIHFCDPKSPWQRGSNENTNGLLCHYLPEVLRPLPSHTARARRHRPLAQHEASTDPRLDDTISGVRRGCCVDPLRADREGVSTSPVGLRAQRYDLAMHWSGWTMRTGALLVAWCWTRTTQRCVRFGALAESPWAHSRLPIRFPDLFRPVSTSAQRLPAECILREGRWRHQPRTAERTGLLEGRRGIRKLGGHG